MNNLLNRTFSNLKFATSLFTQQIQNGILSIIQVRGKKVKLGASSRNRRRTTPGKHRRLYVEDGEWVEPDHLLVRQTGLQFYPGENVMFCADKSLKALVPGHVIISLERVQPYPDSPLYPYVAAGNLVERKFISIIQPQRTGTYKLVEQI